ncbi:MAG: hypothetical protein U9N04_01275 [Patescibacteria group bacterium]|nr:hypothetical protein [Patescibacteria group bacterium]
MGIGSLAKKIIQEYPIAFTLGFLLIGNNVGNYCTTKYIRLNYSDNPKMEAQQVLKEYDNYFFAKPFALGAYKAAKEQMQK